MIIKLIADCSKMEMTDIQELIDVTEDLELEDYSSIAVGNLAKATDELEGFGKVPKLLQCSQNAVAVKLIADDVFYIFGELTDEFLIQIFNKTRARAEKAGCRFIPE